MADVSFDHVTKVFPEGTVAVDDLSLDCRRRRVPDPGRAERLRQDDGAADGGGPREDQRRRHPGGRRAHQRRAPEGPRCRDGLPELRPVSAHDGGEEPRVRPAAAAYASRGGHAARQRRRRDARPPRSLAPQAGSALGRPATARRDGPRARPRAEGVPAGRAAVEPGREAARADARRTEAVAPSFRRHHDLRHARSGRGDDARRSHRRDDRRTPPAARSRRRTSTTIRRTCSSPGSSGARR